MPKKYQLIVVPRVQKDLDNLNPDVLARVKNKIEQLLVNPYIGKKLRGDLYGQYVVRVWPYRIVYLIYEAEVHVLIVKVEHRKDVYR